jgi:putative transposase
MPDELWIRSESLLPAHPLYASPKGGRPRLQKLRPIADGIFYKLRTGCQWNAIPRIFGASSTIHNYFQEWVELGIFEQVWELALAEYEDIRGTSWQHQSLDTASVKSPLGGEKNRPQSDRSGQGYIPHAAKRKRRDKRGRPVMKRDAYRLVVERTHSWANQFRSLKIRWEKKVRNYEALLHISFAPNGLRAARVFG